MTQTEYENSPQNLLDLITTVNADATKEEAKQTGYLRYGEDLVDLKKTGRALLHNKEDYKNLHAWNLEFKNDFDEALGYVIDGLHDGTLTGVDSAGNYVFSDETPFSNDPKKQKAFKAALAYTSEVINLGIANKKLTPPEKKKYNTDLDEDIKNELNAGKDWDEASINAFINLDKENEDGTRATTNRAAKLSKVIANKITRIQNGEYDMGDINADDAISKLQTALEALRDGNISEDEFNLLSLAGYSAGDSTIALGKGTVKEDKWNTLKKLYIDSGMTEELADARVELERIRNNNNIDNQTASIAKENALDAWNKLYLDYANRLYANTNFNQSYHLGNTHYTNVNQYLKDIATLQIDPSTYLKTWLSHPEGTTGAYSNLTWLRNAIPMMIKSGLYNDKFADNGDGTILILDSINPETGYALAYKPESGDLVAVNPRNSTVLLLYLKYKYQQTHPLTVNGVIQWKLGGIIKLQPGGHIDYTEEDIINAYNNNLISEEEAKYYLLALLNMSTNGISKTLQTLSGLDSKIPNQNGNYTSTLNPFLVDNPFLGTNNGSLLDYANQYMAELHKLLAKKSLLDLKAKAKAAGYQTEATEYDPDAGKKGLAAYAASLRKISNNPSDNWDLADFHTEDYERLVAMGADITGLIGSFTGAGTIINAGTGLISTAANLAADIKDKSVTKGLVWSNVLTNLGLAAVGFVPGGNSLKIVKSAIKLAPKLFALYNAAGLVMDPEVLKSWEKVVHDGEKAEFTVQDWKNMAYSIAALRGVVGSGTSTYKARKFGKLVGKLKVSETIKENNVPDVKELKLKGANGEDVTLTQEHLKAIKKAGKDETKIAEILKGAGIKEGEKLPENINDYLPLSKYLATLNSARDKSKKLGSWLRDKSLLGLTKNYQYNTPLVEMFMRNNRVNENLGLLEALKGRGKWSDAGLYSRMLGWTNLDKNLWYGYKPIGKLTEESKPILGNNPIDEENPFIILSKNDIPKRDGIGSLPHLTDAIQISKILKSMGIPVEDIPNLAKFATDAKNRHLDLRGISAERWLRFKDLYNFKHGGILKFLNGGKDSYVELPEDWKWYEDLYQLKKLGNENLRNRNLFASKNLSEHNLNFNLGMAAKKNDAYTSQALGDLVGQDIQNYYDTNFSSDSLDDYIKHYNESAAKIRSTWEGNTEHKANTETGLTAHNKLFQQLFKNRSLNDENEYNIGYLDDLLDIMGTSTWMRRMDRYKNEFENASDEEKIARVHSLKLKDGTTAYVYKKANGDIAKLPVEEFEKLKNLTVTKVSPEEYLSTIDKLKKSGILNTVLDLLESPDGIALARFLLNNSSNKKIAQLERLGLSSVKKSPINEHVQVARDLNVEAEAARQKAQMLSYLKNNKSSKATDNIDALLEAVNKGAQLLMEATHNADTDVKLLIKEADALLKKTYEYNIGVKNDNDTSEANYKKAMYDINAAEQAASMQNLNTFLMEYEARLRLKVADEQTFNDQLSSILMQNAISEDPEYKALYKLYQEETDANKKKEILLAAEDRLKEISNDAYYEYYKRYRRNHNFGGNSSYEMLLRLRKNKGFNPTYDKKGGTIESDRIKARTEDIKELNKTVQNGIKNHLKALDNLSKSTLLAIKKALNQ